MNKKILCVVIALILLCGTNNVPVLGDAFTGKVQNRANARPICSFSDIYPYRLDLS